MRILITGGAGFIGSHTAERFLSEGHEVAIVDDFNDFYAPADKRRNVEEIKAGGRVQVFEGNICDELFIAQTTADFAPEAIVHLAARAGVRPSLEMPLLYEHVNVRGTMVLLEAARKTGCRKFVFASSSSVYGSTNKVPFREDDDVSRPISPYAATKVAGEKICYTYSHLYGLPVVCLRFFTVYGPRQRPDLAIRKFASMMLKGQPILMFGDGKTGRDYTYVADTVAGITAALHHDTAYDIFNLGNSHPVELRQMIATLESALGVTARITPMPDQPGDVPITYADVSKARRLLGYVPATTFETGVGRFVEWLQARTQS